MNNTQANRPSLAKLEQAHVKASTPFWLSCAQWASAVSIPALPAALVGALNLIGLEAPATLAQGAGVTVGILTAIGLGAVLNHKVSSYKNNRYRFGNFFLQAAEQLQDIQKFVQHDPKHEAEVTPNLRSFRPEQMDWDWMQSILQEPQLSANALTAQCYGLIGAELRHKANISSDLHKPTGTELIKAETQSKKASDQFKQILLSLHTGQPTNAQLVALRDQLIDMATVPSPAMMATPAKAQAKLEQQIAPYLDKATRPNKPQPLLLHYFNQQSKLLDSFRSCNFEAEDRAARAFAVQAAYDVKLGQDAVSSIYRHDDIKAQSKRTAQMQIKPA